MHRHSGFVRACAGALVLLLAACGPAHGPGPGGGNGGGGSRTVHLRGTAYEFGRVHTLLAGATIRVAEDPDLQTVVAADGSYDLEVPDRRPVTPYIEAAGYHTIHLQTFTPAGEDLEHVNFQTPSEAIYQALVAIVGLELGADGNPRQCAIVSTFSTRNVRGVSYEDFIGYGAHGVPGATASAEPAIAPPIYFNEQVIPDPTRTESSVDGGVAWIEVPAGTYTITADHPTTEFAPFTATCEPGRVVNANPSWGLHELGLPMPATPAATWSAVRGERVLDALTLADVPEGATVTLRCTGAGCPLSTLAAPVPTGTVDVLAALGAASPAFRPGNTVTLQVDAPAHDSLVTEWQIGRPQQPRTTTLCIPLGLSRPQPC